MKPAIVLSGQTAALGVVRSLGVMEVPVMLGHYEKQAFAQKSRYVNMSFSVPHPERNEDDFINFMLTCAKRYEGAVLIPASDESLVAVSRHREVLVKHFRVACTRWEVTRNFIDKQLAYTLAEQCGIPAPRTLVPHTLVDARCAAMELGFPCLVKPCQGHLFTSHFGYKMVQADSMKQLEEVFERATGAGLEVMLQEIIPGNDREVVNYNAYVWEGKFLTEFTAIHLRNAPPRFGSTRVGISRKIQEVIDPGRLILKELDFNGYACTEFKRDPRDGAYKFLEVNGRHNLSTLLAVRCGINFPWLHYRHLSEGIAPGPIDFREEVYWIDIIRDIGASLSYVGREGHSLADYWRPYAAPHIYATLDRTDLRLFFMRLIAYTRRLGF